MKKEESPKDIGFEKPKKKLREEKSKLKSEEEANDKLLQVKLEDKNGANEGRAEYYCFLGTDVSKLGKKKLVRENFQRPLVCPLFSVTSVMKYVDSWVGR